MALHYQAWGRVAKNAKLEDQLFSFLRRFHLERGGCHRADHPGGSYRTLEGTRDRLRCGRRRLRPVDEAVTSARRAG